MYCRIGQEEVCKQTGCKWMPVIGKDCSCIDATDILPPVSVLKIKAAHQNKQKTNLIPQTITNKQNQAKVVKHFKRNREIFRRLGGLCGICGERLNEKKFEVERVYCSIKNIQHPRHFVPIHEHCVRNKK